jgi:uncharacterized cupredoxin-like copper-binding protein
MKRLSIALLASAALVGAACGSAGDHADHARGGDPGSGGRGDVLGAPADASDADREIKVMASDNLRFDPSSFEVSSGEVITFIVHNAGKTDHEFVLGDAAYQKSHGADMHDEGHMMESDNGISIAPGDTEELTWEFTEPGEVLYGCHEPGHYEGGMVGTITVT